MITLYHGKKIIKRNDAQLSAHAHYHPNSSSWYPRTKKHVWHYREKDKHRYSCSAVLRKSNVTQFLGMMTLKVGRITVNGSSQTNDPVFESLWKFIRMSPITNNGSTEKNEEWRSNRMERDARVIDGVIQSISRSFGLGDR